MKNKDELQQFYSEQLEPVLKGLESDRISIVANFAQFGNCSDNCSGYYCNGFDPKGNGWYCDISCYPGCDHLGYYQEGFYFII